MRVLLLLFVLTHSIQHTLTLTIGILYIIYKYIHEAAQTLNFNTVYKNSCKWKYFCHVLSEIRIADYGFYPHISQSNITEYSEVIKFCTRKKKHSTSNIQQPHILHIVYNINSHLVPEKT